MNVLIAGGGSIGVRLLHNIRAQMPEADITLWHTSGKKLVTGEIESVATKVVYNIADAIQSNPKIAIISCPTSLHVDVGLEFANRSTHLFIEKPISNSICNVDKLIEIVQRNKLILMVGYNLRFYRPLILIKD